MFACSVTLTTHLLALHYSFCCVCFAFILYGAHLFARLFNHSQAHGKEVFSMKWTRRFDTVSTHCASGVVQSLFLAFLVFFFLSEANICIDVPISLSGISSQAKSNSFGNRFHLQIISYWQSRPPIARNCTRIIHLMHVRCFNVMAHMVKCIWGGTRNSLFNATCAFDLLDVPLTTGQRVPIPLTWWVHSPAEGRRWYSPIYAKNSLKRANGRENQMRVIDSRDRWLTPSATKYCKKGGAKGESCQSESWYRQPDLPFVLFFAKVTVSAFVLPWIFNLHLNVCFVRTKAPWPNRDRMPQRKTAKRTAFTIFSFRLLLPFAVRFTWKRFKTYSLSWSKYLPFLCSRWSKRNGVTVRACDWQMNANVPLSTFKTVAQWGRTAKN